MVKNLMQCRRSRFNPWIRKIPWRREWQPTPASLPEKSWRSLAGYSPSGRKESDTIERLTLFIIYDWYNSILPQGQSLRWVTQSGVRIAVLKKKMFFLLFISLPLVCASYIGASLQEAHAWCRNYLHSRKGTALEPTPWRLSHFWVCVELWK